MILFSSVLLSFISSSGFYCTVISMEKRRQGKTSHKLSNQTDVEFSQYNKIGIIFLRTCISRMPWDPTVKNRTQNGQEEVTFVLQDSDKHHPFITMNHWNQNYKIAAYQIGLLRRRIFFEKFPIYSNWRCIQENFGTQKVSKYHKTNKKSHIL